MRIACAIVVAAPLVGALAGCEDTGFPIFVDLKTDLRPGDEFDGVQVDLFATASSAGTALRTTRRTIGALDGVEMGARVAELEGVEPGAYVLRLTLLDESGGFVADHSRLVRVEAATAVTLVITRDCAAVRCPLPGDPIEAQTCAGGGCVDPGCDAAGDCPSECTSAAQCPALSDCARAQCVSGACFYDADHAACGAGGRCHVESGCAGATDAGVADAAVRDAATDARATDAGCAGAGAFEGPMNLTPLNTPANECCPSISADGLELFFASQVASEWQLFVARRDSTGDPFELPSALTSLNGTFLELSEPELNADGLSMWFTARIAAGPWTLYYAVRSSVGGEFSKVLSLGDMFAPLESPTAPSITADGLTMVLADGESTLWLAAYEGAEFHVVRELTTLGSPAADAYPGISPNGLEIFFASRRADAQFDLYRSSRPSHTVEFETPAPIDINTASTDSDPELGPDGMELYFASNRPGGAGGNDLYVASRSCRR